MASTFTSLAAYSDYKDRYYKGTQEEYTKDMASSTIVYIGNLSFYTTEEQIYELFSTVGEIKRVIMGLDRVKRTPCGFCFVEYYRLQEVQDCLKYVNDTKLDDRTIKVDLDYGFRDGRQFGRGRSGGQVCDERREEYDAGRGGYGVRMRGTAYDDTAVPSGGDYAGGNQQGFRRAHKRRGEDDHEQSSHPLDRRPPRFPRGRGRGRGRGGRNFY